MGLAGVLSPGLKFPAALLIGVWLVETGSLRGFLFWVKWYFTASRVDF